MRHSFRRRLSWPAIGSALFAAATIGFLWPRGQAVRQASAEGGPAPRMDAWRVLGPGGGGTTRRPAISPHDPSLMVEGCDMTGSYISLDSGDSWRLFHLGWVVEAFVFDPRDPNVIYAASKALWRSEDRGRTWRMVFPSPGKRTVAHGWGDHADVVFTTDDPFYPSGRETSILAVAVDPADSSHLLIALRTRPLGPPGSYPEGRAALLESRDRGRTWRRVTDLGLGRVFALWIEPNGAARALTEGGAYEGTRTEWQRFEGPGAQRFDSAGFGRDPASGRTLAYATAPLVAGGGGGIYASEDGGRMWQRANGALLDLIHAPGKGAEWGPAAGSRPHFGPVAVSAGHGLAAYVGLRGLRRAASGPQFNGIARTVDGGRTWTIVHEEPDRPSANLLGSWIEQRALEDGHSVWFDAPYDLAAAPGDPDVCLATDLFRTYRTKDGGKNWAQGNSAPRGGDRWVSRGLDVTTAYGVHFDPFDSKRVFISYTDIGLFRSEDGAESWIGSTQGVPKAWRNTTYWIVFDPEVKGLVWGAFSGTHDLPRPKMWRRSDPDSFRGGVGISTDGGRTWTPSWQGLPEAAVTHLLLEPNSPKGRRTLYACAFGRGVFKSTDGGRSWLAKNAGIEGRQPFAWRISRASDGTLYLVVARRSERGRIGDADDGALYRSRDGGERWEKMALPAGTNGPNGITPDPADPARLYLSAWAVAAQGGDTGGGVLLSENRGLTWRNVLPEAQHVYDLTLDPRNPSVLYACGFDQAAWRSGDRGRTWVRLRGFNFKWGHRVVSDPVDPSRVYITTFGGSVWHGPATGDPRAPEDVVSEVGRSSK